MTDKLQLYTCGTWIVKSGMEQDFIEVWQAFADWTSRDQVGAGAGTLLQNEADPSMFLSFGPWENLEVIAKWRSRPEFQDFVARARELCNEVKPQTMKVVGYSNPEDF
jgi:heme-degrading monooxygenase HmoA